MYRYLLPLVLLAGCAGQLENDSSASTNDISLAGAAGSPSTDMAPEPAAQPTEAPVAPATRDVTAKFAHQLEKTACEGAISSAIVTDGEEKTISLAMTLTPDCLALCGSTDPIQYLFDHYIAHNAKLASTCISNSDLGYDCTVNGMVP